MNNFYTQQTFLLSLSDPFISSLYLLKPIKEEVHLSGKSINITDSIKGITGSFFLYKTYIYIQHSVGLFCLFDGV